VHEQAALFQFYEQILSPPPQAQHRLPRHPGLGFVRYGISQAPFPDPEFLDAAAFEMGPDAPQGRFNLGEFRHG
jgi:hypothetical protein